MQINYKKANKQTKMRSKELIPVVQHPKRWLNFCMSEDQKKEIKTVSNQQWIKLRVLKDLDI